MLGSVHLTDGSVHDIVGAGEVRPSLPSGASYLLQHVHHVPNLLEILVSVTHQLRESGCRVSLSERCFTFHLGSLRIARGASVGTRYHCI